MILVIDIGNSSTCVGLYARGRVSRLLRLDTTRTTAARVAQLIRRVAGRTNVDGACVASVVPRVNGTWSKALRSHTGRAPLFVTHKLELGVAIHYPKPVTIGADRLANAAGGVVRYGAPLIVADFGTAVTFDVVSRRGYVGGVIAPGLPLMFHYMEEKTAKLPLIGPGPVRHAVGQSTMEAMRMGAQWGYRGLIREILSELKGAPGLAGAKLVATGGHAEWIVKGMRLPLKVDKDLTLFGIGRIYELNRP
jgi:type III pantothenate kinase